MAVALSPRLRDAQAPPAACVALIVEDDPPMAETLKNYVASLGHEWLHAVTLDDAREALAHGGFCYALLDMQIPPRDGAPPIVSCGETVLRELRAKLPSRNEAGHHRFPIIVVTSYSRDPEYVTRMMKMGADDFVAKPIASQSVVPDKVREALEAAGRSSHAACAAMTPSAAAPAALVLDGERRRGRSAFLVHGERRDLQNAKYVTLVRLLVAREGGRDGWVSKDALGIAHAQETPSRIGKALLGLLPDGKRVVETDGAGRVRLNPRVVAEIDWVGHASHPEVAIQKLARERRDRR